MGKNMIMKDLVENNIYFELCPKSHGKRDVFGNNDFYFLYAHLKFASTSIMVKITIKEVFKTSSSNCHLRVKSNPSASV